MKFERPVKIAVDRSLGRLIGGRCHGELFRVTIPSKPRLCRFRISVDHQLYRRVSRFG